MPAIEFQRGFVDSPGHVPTQDQIRRVLASPTSLEIRGEYYTGPAEGALDDVVLAAGR